MRVQNLIYAEEKEVQRIENLDWEEDLDERDIQLLLNFISDLDSQVTNLNKEKVSLEDEVSDLRGEIKALEQDKDKLENYIQDLRDSFA